MRMISESKKLYVCIPTTDYDKLNGEQILSMWDQLNLIKHEKFACNNQVLVLAIKKDDINDKA